MVSKEDIEFQQEPDMDVVCPICLHVVMDNPHQTLCCGRHFCGTCISRVESQTKVVWLASGKGLVSQKKACPNCRGECKTFPDKNFERTIGSKVVYCQKRGKTTEECCDWCGELKHYREHTSIDCPYELVECPAQQCTKLSLRIDMKDHVANQCPFRPYECQYCGLMGKTYTFIKDKHYPVCLQYPVGCTQCSDKEVTRAEHLPHIKNKCPMEPVECVYSWLGCKEMPRRKDAEKHYSDAHHHLLSKVYKELREDTDQIISDLNELHLDSNQTRYELNGLHRQGHHLKEQGRRLEEQGHRLEEETMELEAKDANLEAEMRRKYSSLQSEYKSLRVDFNQLSDLHHNLLGKHFELKDTIKDTRRKFTYFAIFIIVTVIIFCFEFATLSGRIKKLS